MVWADVKAACDAAANLCYDVCALRFTKDNFSGNLSYDLCIGGCADSWSQCTGFPHPQASGSSPGQTNMPDEGVFDPGSSIDRSDLFGISLVNSAKLESVCSKVPSAQFASSERLYGCLNKTCAGPGKTCRIVCTEGKCFGGMPNKPASGLTLIGILQNGDNVYRGGSAEEPARSGSGAGGEEEGDGEEDPECGIGGCGTIY